MTNDRYDVIIIGTGAGGGTLALRLAPTGKRILLLERGGYLQARARQLGRQGGVRRRRLPGTRPGTARDGRGVPSRPALLRRRQHQGLRRRAVSPARARLRRARACRRHLAGLAARLRRVRALLHRRPRSCSMSTASAARIRPSRRASGPIPTRRCRHEPRIQELCDALARRATIPSTCRSASCSTSGRASRRRTAPAFAATPSTAFPA